MEQVLGAEGLGRLGDVSRDMIASPLPRRIRQGEVRYSWNFMAPTEGGR